MLFRSPNLLFMLPPNAVWIANKIAATHWPQRLQVHVIDEPLISASAVWNAMLGIWNLVKLQPAWETPAAPGGEYPIKVSDLSKPPVAAAAAAAPVARLGRAVLDPARAARALADMLPLEGMLGCAAVDATTGLVLARDKGYLLESRLLPVAIAWVGKRIIEDVFSYGLQERTIRRSQKSDFC